MSVLTTNEFECINEVLRDSFHWQKITHSDSVMFMRSEIGHVLAVVACWNSRNTMHYRVYFTEKSQSFDTHQNAMNYVEILAMLGEI